MSERTASRGRVLVVEDEAYVRESLVEILGSRRFDASAAGSVAEALAHLGRAPVDVVLSDLRMPGADGLELVRRMQTAAPDVPVVILTGHGNVASAVECLKAGASDYVLKPAEPEALEVVARPRPRGARPAPRGALPAQRGGRPGRAGDRGERALAARDGHGRGRRRRGLRRAASRGSRAPGRSSWPGACTRSPAAPPGPS